MAFFIVERLEPIVQVGDKLRISVSESFGTPDEPSVSKVEIEPADGVGFFDVAGQSRRDWFLDWVYTADGEAEITIKITTGTGMDAVEHTKEVTTLVVTAQDELLFSNDEDLRAKEHDIVDWLPEGYSSWNHIHRQAQKSIIDWLDEIRILKSDGSRWLPSELARRDQVRRLSTYTVLRMIYGSISNQVDDVFDKKRQIYAGLEKQAKTRNYISLEEQDTGRVVQQELRSMRLVRR